MSSKVTFDYSKASPFISGHEVEFMKKLALDAKEVLVSKSGAGNDFLGWIDSERFRGTSGYRYWRFLSRRQGGY